MHLFDGNGALVKKVVDGVTTVYIGSHYEKNLSSAQVIKYFYFNGQRVAMNEAGVVYYIAGDHLGTRSVMLNSSGNKVAESRHYPYGVERWRSGTLPTDYRFTGARQEAALGLYHMGARFYDPSLARWLSADTLIPEPGNPQAFNGYSYVLGNPLRYVDPTGHFSDEELAVLFGFVDADGNADLKAMYASALWNSFADDFKAMLGAAQFGDILVGAGAEWEGALGQQVPWQGQAMFVKTVGGRLALWDLGSKTETSLSKLSGADKWVLFQSGKENGFGDYRRTNYYRGSQDLPGPSLGEDWTEGANNFIDVYEDLEWPIIGLDSVGIVAGIALLDPEPISKCILGAVALTVSVGHLIYGVASGDLVKDRTPVLFNGPRPDLGMAMP